jgi:hypothetical protein
MYSQQDLSPLSSAPLTADTQVHPRSVNEGFTLDKVVLEQVVLQVPHLICHQHHITLIKDNVIK